MTRRRLAVLALVLGALALLGGSAVTPDLAVSMLEAKYGGPPSRFVTLPSGARVHVRDQGNPRGPVLLLLHGSNSSLHTWKPWVRLLGDAFRIVSMDLPGHGLTGPVPGDDYSLAGMVRAVEETRTTLGLTRFFLAGNSMGGNVSFRYTLAHPDAVERLVLVDASGVNHLLPQALQPVPPIGFRLIRSPVTGPIAARVTPRRFIEKTTRAAFCDQSKVTPEMIDRYHELLLHPGNRRATRLRAEASPGLEAADHLGEIRVPTLVLSGMEDTLVPVQAARLFHERIPGSVIIEYPRVGHIPMEEIPERSAADVRAFLIGGG